MTDNVSVAIVDDEIGVVRTYELLFKKRNIPVAFVAYDGPEAIKKFRNATPKPGIMIIDFRLPSMNGLELIAEILKIAPATKIVFLSGDDTVKLDAIQAGARVFLKKPAGIKKMTGTIHSLMGVVQ